ncbi:DUF4336 domain-containing protein [Arthrobacter sp. H35-D1]|uniref:DUF4336 domain-containing protein n=1 Tax=Arthrobacter sp. H35-D1 TaxID=3046202 RepID=UPI0024B94347|nr:DUF4336 domain-containing protein [Arthrobacter sp. H35-D1]MDJ0312609.1 DUF4336 domain-containing protein [Arthrobacter sp. H35-D1]
MVTLEPLGKDLFVVDGPVVRDMGVRFNTRMTVARLRDGSVWIASPVQVSFAALAEIIALGPVRYLVSPTPRHFWRLNAWHRLFPEAQLFSSPITPITLKKGDLPLAGILGEPDGGLWAPDLEQVQLRGIRWLNEVVFFHTPSRALLVEDVIQIHERQPGHHLRNALVAGGGVAAPWGGVGRDIRLTFRDKAAARESIEQILQWDFDKLVVAHGPVVTGNARETVERAFAWLDRRSGGR